MDWQKLVLELLRFIWPFVRGLLDDWLVKAIQEEAAYLRQQGVDVVDEKAAQRALLLRVRDRVRWWEFSKRRTVNRALEALDGR